MARSFSTLFRRVLSSLLLPSILLAVVAGVCSQYASAQDPPDIAVEGYITAVHSPTDFYVDGKHVFAPPGTGYSLIGDKQTVSDSTLRAAVRVGAYVQVVGAINRLSNSAVATSVLLRDDWDKKLKGVGVIDKIVSAGPEPVFQADGYHIRVTSTTQTVFQGDLKTLANVSANTWLHYEGKRDNTGVLVASKAAFILAKPAKFKAVKGLEVVDMGLEPPSSSHKTDTAPGSDTANHADTSDQQAVLTEDGKVKLGLIGGWHKIPADQALQERVRRVGMLVIPEYQKQLPSDHPSKINFRFYAVDAAKIRTEVCSFDGLILVPMQVVERLKIDDRLAAVLADGVAYNLQRQAAQVVAENRVLLGTEIASEVAGAFVPGLGLVAYGTGAAEGKMQIAMEEQRGRVALALLADAGFDPRQAPEAWRLLGPKHLPKDLNDLKYPDRSGYQLGILNLQYSSASAVANAGH